MTDPLILQAGKKDLHRVRSVRLCAIEDAPEALASTYEKETQLAGKNWWEVLGLPRHVTLLASVGSLDVGIAIGGPYGDQYGLYGMWVAPSARGAGVGDGLISMLIRWSISLGAERVYLDVADSNRPAIDLCERNAFGRTGRRSAAFSTSSHTREH